MILSIDTNKEFKPITLTITLQTEKELNKLKEELYSVYDAEPHPDVTLSYKINSRLVKL